MYVAIFFWNSVICSITRIIHLAILLLLFYRSSRAEAPTTSAAKLQALRRLMLAHNIDAYYIPSVDAHQSEYISARDKRIAYISDFTGSAGQIFVTADAAALWTDTRYHIQAAEQLDAALWTLQKSGQSGVPTTLEWLPDNIRIGVDPYLIDAESFRRQSNAFQTHGSQLVEITPNLVDAVWTDKPALKLARINALPQDFSGRSVAQKVADLRAVAQKNAVTAVVVSALDDVACE